MRGGALLAGLVLLTGCSDSPDDVRADYCELVTEQQAALSEIMAGDRSSALLRARPVLRELADEAPRDITDDWDRLLDALDGLDEALGDAGVEPGTYDAEDPPPGMTRTQRERIERAAAQLADPEVSAAFENVQQQAKDVCKAPLYR